MDKVFKYCFLFVLLLFVREVEGQVNNQILKAAEENYDKGNYEEAENGFAEVFADKPGSTAAYNMGNAQFKQEKYGLASQSFQDAARMAQTKEVKAKASFNLGNALIAEGLLEESIEAFKEAIRNNPQDREAKHNLLKAKEMLKQQQQEQEQQEQENQDQENKDQNQDQGQNQDQSQQEDNQQDQTNPENGQQDENEGQSAEYDENDPAESIEQLLKIMEEEEKKVQQKLRKRQERPNKSTKRW